MPMSSKRDTLFEHFRAVAGSTGDYRLGQLARESVNESALVSPAVRADSATATKPSLSSTLIAALPGISLASLGQTQSGGSVLSGAAKVFESGLGIVPLVGGLLGLFGGGSTKPPQLVKYAMPEKQFFTGADIGSGIARADYGQAGTLRSYGTAPSATTSTPTETTPTPSMSPGSTSGHQIHVNVQAMDAQSFLDRSNDIAQAVRYAMLNLNSINDVVNDL